MLMTVVLGFLGKKQGTEMQLLNHWWYQKAVSRILTRVKIAFLDDCPILYLTSSDKMLSCALFCVDKRSLKTTMLVKGEFFNFHDYLVIQIGKDLYTLENDVEE